MIVIRSGCGGLSPLDAAAKRLRTPPAAASERRAPCPVGETQSRAGSARRFFCAKRPAVTVAAASVATVQVFPAHAARLFRRFRIALHSDSSYGFRVQLVRLSSATGVRPKTHLQGSPTLNFPRRMAKCEHCQMNALGVLSVWLLRGLSFCFEIQTDGAGTT